MAVENSITTEQAAFWQGRRVELHPATDAWMMGDRYGEVVDVGRKYLWVKMDRSGKTRKCLPWMVNEITRY